ncbi:HlyD family secretion protein [Sphingomonas oryzagri]
MTLENSADDIDDIVVDDPHLVTGSPLPPPRETGRPGRERWRLPLLGVGVVIAIAGALFFYLHGGRYETTDNAYFQSGLGSIAANVSGPVMAVEVHENQHVRAGQVLFRIDPAPFRTAVAQAEAALAEARTQVEVLRANYGQGLAELRAAQDQLAYASKEAGRQKSLLAEGISSQNQYDQAVLARNDAAQGIKTAQQHNAAIAASLSGDVDAPVDRQPAVKRAQAALDKARLDLGYTVIRAPQDGIVTKVNQLQVGDYVSAAKPVFTLAATHIWVEANYKESQLDHMRLGQPASFKVDAFPDLKLTGRVSSFSPGTGNSFALLPPENATGNWVKVVQRLPVEFEIDRIPADIPLHAGLSVEVTVDTGYRRHLFAGVTPPAARPAR